MRHLKRDVLALLADGRPRWTFQICEAVRYAEQRSMSSYLRRIERQGLIRSQVGGDSFALRFRITSKGVERLRWFQNNPNYFARRYGGRGKVNV